MDEDSAAGEKNWEQFVLEICIIVMKMPFLSTFRQKIIWIFKIMLADFRNGLEHILSRNFVSLSNSHSWPDVVGTCLEALGAIYNNKIYTSEERVSNVIKYS